MGTLTELWGPPGSGKTHAAIAGWPDPLLVDTAFTSLGFRKAEVDPDPNERGESWSVLLKLMDWGEEEAEDRYHYLDEFPDGVAFAAGFDTVILDNAADLRVLAVNAWAEDTGNDWPQQAQWGMVNDRVDWLLRQLTREHHVVVVSQMKDEYVDGDKTGGQERDGPKRMEYKADLRFQLELDDEGRHAWVRKNRWMDPTSDDYPAQGTDAGPSFDLEEIMLLSEVPEEVWRV